MTILDKSAIVGRLRNETLVVRPILTSDQLGAASIDLRLGNIVLMIRARGSSHVDPAIIAHELRREKGGHGKALRLWQKHERYVIPFGASFLLHPGMLVLVPTLEWVMLPLDLHGSVTARSTWAREGLSIATATFVEPGYQGIITLELANLSQIPIRLYPGLRIAQIAFSNALGDGNFSKAHPKKGQYQISFEPRQGNIVNVGDLPFLPEQDEVESSSKKTTGR